jgi:hypothetical protein
MVHVVLAPITMRANGVCDAVGGGLQVNNVPRGGGCCLGVGSVVVVPAMMVWKHPRQLSWLAALQWCYGIEVRPVVRCTYDVLGGWGLQR